MTSLTMHRVRACIYFVVLVAFAAASILLQFYNPSLFNPNFFLHSKPRHEWRQYHLPPLTQPLSAEMLEIRQAAADAWSAYAATGMTGDDLRPIQGGAVDHMHVHATLYDSLGTLYVMGLHTEFEAAVERAVALGAPRTLLFPTSSFEYNIRIIGGLLSAAQLSGDSRLLSLASDAAHTLLSSAYFLWPSPLMVGRVRMQPLTFRNFPFWLTARIMDATWMLWQRASQDPSFNYLAKVGTFSLEFRALSSALGNPTLACIADKMQSHIVGNVSSPWPLGENLYHHTPIHTAFDSVNGSGAVHGTVSFGSGNDSFYEYLLKSHLIMPHDNPQLYVELYRRLTRQLNFEYGRVNDHTATQGTFQLLFEHRGRLFLSRHPGGTYHEQLACFLPGLMMLGAMMLPDRAMARDQIIAEKLLDGCLWTYTEPSLSQHGLGADFIDLQDVQNSNEGVHKYSGEYDYYLRPETVESVFLAWRATRDLKWRKAAWGIFTALKKLQASGGGFHGIVDVTLPFNSSLNQNAVDEQPSYFIAETLKYLFLTFDDPERLSLQDWVFSTECHPLRMPNNRSAWSIRSCAV